MKILLVAPRRGNEQLHRAVGFKVRQALINRVGHALDFKNPLFGYIQPLARGSQHLHIGRLGKNAADQLSALQQVFKVIHDKQQLARAQVFQQLAQMVIAAAHPFL